MHGLTSFLDFQILELIHFNKNFQGGQGRAKGRQGRAKGGNAPPPSNKPCLGLLHI